MAVLQEIREHFGPRVNPLPSRRALLIENALIVVFAVLGVFGALHHELWRDETQAWLLARDSASLIDLFNHSYYEGHPLVWHTCLHALTRLGHHPLIMQGFSLLLGIGSVILVIKKAPFSLLERGLIAFGYFSLFEYTLLSRCYGLGVFLVFAFCTLYSQHSLGNGPRARPPYWALTLLLALLANTSVLGLIMSGALAIALCVRLWVAPGVKVIRHLAVLLFAWGLCVLQVARAFVAVQQQVPDAGSASGAASSATASATVSGAAALGEAATVSISPLLDGLHKLFQIGVYSYWPLPAFRFHFWNGHLLDQPLQGTIWDIAKVCGLGAIVGVTVWLIWRLLRRTPLFLVVYGAGSLGFLGLFSVVYIGSIRHHGHLFILLLACLWLAASTQSNQYWGGQQKQPITQRRASQRRVPQPALPQPDSPQRWTFPRRLWLGVLCLHLLAGTYAYISDWRYPFSASVQTAHVLRDRQLSELPLLAIHQRPASSISAYLNRALYYPEAEQEGSYWDISYPEETDPQEILAALADYGKTHPTFVAVLSQPLSTAAMTALATEALSGPVAPLLVQPITYAGPSIVESEAFYLYQISQAAAVPPVSEQASPLKKN